MSDPEDNCINRECPLHDLESSHCCVSYQSVLVTRCTRYKAREAVHITNPPTVSAGEIALAVEVKSLRAVNTKLRKVMEAGRRVIEWWDDVRTSIPGRTNKALEEIKQAIEEARNDE